MQVDGAAVLGGGVEDGLGAAGRVRVEVRAGADDGGAHLDRVVEHGEPVGPGDAGEQAGHGDGGEVG
ncbi:hypothetical protein Sgou_02580 [Streptomyces gougerotii]|uniref:Uncharacterized protein n=1 Tax=Streptomyces gougerotii TaxID=53448 RepID=A0ABQ1CZE1_9ACTN|nr:hypothetical protein Sgou_02580 [Streptomyces gougerotii]